MSTDFGFNVSEGPEYYFISYNTEDAGRVAAICRVLHARGLPMWYDYGIPHGELWQTELAKQIRGCREAIFFITRGIFEKARYRDLLDVYTWREYDIAKHRGKRMLIVLLDEIGYDCVPDALTSWRQELDHRQGLIAYDLEPEAVAEGILAQLGFEQPKANAAVETKQAAAGSAETSGPGGELPADADRLSLFSGQLTSPVRFADGSAYIGGWAYGLRAGFGRWTSADGKESYVGEWALDARSGRGKTTCADGSVYDGEWKNGKQNGPGVFTYADGGVYEGEWKDGRRCGLGRMRYANGDLYEGAWHADLFSGYGVYTSAKGSVYDGEWKDGKRNGHGVYTCGGVYDGEWKDGKENGHGVFTYVDGSVYDGEWRDGRQNGQGIVTWSNGCVYDGEWKDGRENGHGILTYEDGMVYDGEWRDGRQNGQGVVTYSDGTVCDVVYRNGKVLSIVRR